MNLKEYAAKGMSYQAFHDLHAQLLKENKTTGTNQSEAYLNYGRLNQHRMDRVHRTLKLEDGLVRTAKNLKQPITALVITEGWCGDSAQNIPVLVQLETVAPKLSVKIVLRDENLPLIDLYLTNGTRSIPKVVFFDSESGKELAVWGPRPAYAQQLMVQGKANNVPKEEITTAIQLWYSKDKTLTMQRELKEILERVNV
jgi:hypothetical protein